MKKTCKIICIYQKSGISLPSSSGKKPERTTNFIHLLNFFIIKHISKNSQKGMNYLHSFEVAKAKNIDCLEKVYGRYSNEKARADYHCRMMMESEGGHDYKIIGYNSSFFTVAWIAGNALRVETAYNSFVIREAAE